MLYYFSVPQFPPKLMVLAYKSFNRTCRNESQVTQESINKFNDGEDFSKLPDDRPLKCYMLCQLLHMEMMEPDVPMIKMEIAVENIGVFSEEEKDIFLNMGKKCTRLKTPKSKDSCDMAYEFNKCMKKGDINVSSGLYRERKGTTNSMTSTAFKIVRLFSVNNN